MKSDYLTWRVRVAGEGEEPDLTYFVDAHDCKPRWALSNRMRLTNRQIYCVASASMRGAVKSLPARPQRGIWPPVGPIAISCRLPQPVSEGDSVCS